LTSPLSICSSFGNALFSRKGYRAVQIEPRENLTQHTEPAKDKIHEIESKNPDDIDAIVKHDADKDCGNIVVVKTRITTIFHVPEFKSDPVWRWVRIGCINLYLPWFTHMYVRDNMKVLYACIGHNNNLQPFLVQQLIDCSKVSALSAAVIGVVLVSVPVALVVFKALFIKCVSVFAESEIGCLVPDLVVESEVGQWKRV